MKFLIATPSYNQLAYLGRAVASVRDQVCEGIEIHHHVQDAGSTDGTVEFLQAQTCNVGAKEDSLKRDYVASLKDVENRSKRSLKEAASHLVGRHSESMELSGVDCDLQKSGEYQISFASERDDGMYDALNKGFAVGNGSDVCAYLNCDEQYLEGTLGKVAEYFRENPETDILFGGFLAIDEKGELLAFRKACPLRRCFIEADYLYNFTGAMFMGRRVLDELQGFDPRYRVVGDTDFVLRALKAGFKCATIDAYLAAFTYRKDNLSHGRDAREEKPVLNKDKRTWPLKLAGLVNFVRRVEKVLCGAAREKFPLEYDLYMHDISQRTHFVAESGTPKWPG